MTKRNVIKQFKILIEAFKNDDSFNYLDVDIQDVTDESYYYYLTVSGFRGNKYFVLYFYKTKEWKRTKHEICFTTDRADLIKEFIQYNTTLEFQTGNSSIF